MNELIKKLAKPYLMHERFSRYGESTEEEYCDFLPEELEDFVMKTIDLCCDYIEGLPTSEEGTIILTKSFIIANLKGYFGAES